jgi:hypothetical protein
VNDPHVEVLNYEFISLNESHDFTAAEPWSGRLGDFDCRLETGHLEATPNKHFVSEAAARQELEPHLRAWELQAELQDDLRVCFRFSSARVVDRRLTAGSVTVAVATVEAAGAVEAARVTVGHSTYPAPAAGPLAASPLVNELLGWIRDLRAGHRMLVIAYLILTRLEFEYGGRRWAASALHVEPSVLSMLGRLSVKNDPVERRKVKGTADPLTETEKQWIRAVLPRLIFQAAAAAANAQPPRLTMTDLPAL